MQQSKFKLQKYFQKAFLLGALVFVLELVLIVLVALTIKMYVVSAFWVSGESMIPTLQDNDLILVNHIGYSTFFGDPKRGDIVVMIPQSSPEDYYVKRIIGMPKETISFYNGKVRIGQNDEASEIITEGYLSETNGGHTCPKPYTTTGKCGPRIMIRPLDVEIPENHYFIMGDNRTSSTDSRAWNNKFAHKSGATARKSLVGRAFARIWFGDYNIPHFEWLPQADYQEKDQR